MCMWQSHAFCGALSFGDPVPVEFDTGWAWPCRPIVAAVAAIATMEAFLMKVRRSFTLIVMSVSPTSKDGAPGVRPSRRRSGAAYSDYHLLSGGHHEQHLRFSRHHRAARFLRHGPRARARVAVAAAGVCPGT